MVSGSDPDLLIQRHFEELLSPYEEQRLAKLILLGGAFSDRFVEWRELERGLAECYGGRRKVGRLALVPGCSSPIEEGDVFRARRFPSGAIDRLPEDCAGAIYTAYDRRLRIVDTAAHREALGRCLGLIVDEFQDLLRVQCRTGMTSREIAELLGRPGAELEDLFCRIKKFLAGAVRLRLSRTA
jgi:hypothetical protein